jgi:hypothetical protein
LFIQGEFGRLGRDGRGKEGSILPAVYRLDEAVLERGSAQTSYDATVVSVHRLRAGFA